MVVGLVLALVGCRPSHTAGGRAPREATIAEIAAELDVMSGSFVSGHRETFRGILTG